MLGELQIALSKLRLESAKEALRDAYENYKGGRYKTANNRAYYAIFHAVRSVLALESKDFKSHAKAIGYFNKEYINKGLLPADFNRKISGAFKTRTRSDYDDFFTATSEEAETTLNNAHQFVEEVEKYLAVRLEAEAPRFDAALSEDEYDDGLEP
jgi:uncharacterized protein (UPF0332 family)